MITISGWVFLTDSYLAGRYDAEAGLWAYDQTFNDEHVYVANFETSLTEGEYSLNVVVDNQNFNMVLNYNGTHELPLIPSYSFQKQFDEQGNLFLKWKAPLYVESELSTSVRVYINVYNGSTYSNHYLYVKVPSHLSSLFVPKDIVDILKVWGNNFSVYVHTRTNDGSNRSYSNEVMFDQIPGFSDCDVNNDGKTGLPEAVHALRIAAGEVIP